MPIEVDLNTRPHGSIHRGVRPAVRAALVALVALVAALVSGHAAAQDEMRGEIREGTLFRIPIEVREWDYVETPRTILAGGEAAEDVLVQDLIFSGFFEVRRQAFVVPGSGTTTTSRPLEAIASGTVRKRRGRVELEGAVVDAGTGKLIFRKAYDLGEPPDRWAIHAYADDIVLYLTGEKGVAQTKIAFVGDALGHKEIFLVDYDGAAVEMKTDLRSISVSPRWSAQGDRLAFTTFARGAPDLVGLRLKDGKIWTISGRPGMNSAPCWTPEDDRILASLSFEGNSELYLLEESGKIVRRLTHDPGIDTTPTMNPQGTRIAFTSDRSGEPQIFIMDADGTNQRRLTFIGKHSDSPDWSPKGDRILFVSLIDRVFDICSINPDGSDLRRLTGGEVTCENPRWSPDGRQVVFARRAGGERKLFIMSADGTNLRQLTWLRGNQYNPDWSPPLGR